MRMFMISTDALGSDLLEHTTRVIDPPPRLPMRPLRDLRR
jgi:hypothetical protein